MNKIQKTLAVILLAVAGLAAIFPSALATSVGYWDFPDLGVKRNLTVVGTVTAGTLNCTTAGFISTGTITAPYGIATTTAAISGNATVGGTLAVTGALSASAAFVPDVANKATINALASVVGSVFSCSDCTNTYTLCVATGTAANQYREVGTATGCK
jgi:hypothetical protein